jgi:hypothetical protein
MIGVLLLSLTLVGCGGGSNKDAEKNFIGTWKAVEMESDGETMDLREYADWGLDMEITLILAQDNTFTLDLMGDKQEGNWKAKDASTCTLTADGDSMDIRLADNRLTMDVDGEKIVFEKSNTP